MESRTTMIEVASRFGKPSIRYLRKVMIYTIRKVGTKKGAAEAMKVPYSTYRRWIKTLKISV